MSLDLQWTIVPTEPKVLGTASTSMKHLLILALNGGMEERIDRIREADLREPVKLTERSQAHLFLLGALATLPRKGPSRPADFHTDLADEISELLAELEKRGELMIQTVPS